jgi:diacylglycerol kinase family enzyme
MDSNLAGDMTSAPLVIVNPVAGPSASRLLERDRLKLALRRRGLDPSWIETRIDYHAGQIIDDHPGDGPVVVIGGDGTVQPAASRLCGGDRALLAVPRGSGNVFARSLGVPLLLDQALALLKRGRVVRVDVGRMAGEVFLLGVGIGLDAHVIRGADRALKRRVGGLAYVYSAAQNLPVEHYEFEIEIDGRRFRERAAAIHVANFGTRAGPFVLPPMADGRDGMLDVVIMRAEGLEETLNLLASPLMRDPPLNTAARYERGQSVSVQARKDLPVQLDGEDRGDHPGLFCEIEPGVLPVVVPG